MMTVVHYLEVINSGSEAVPVMHVYFTWDTVLHIKRPKELLFCCVELGYLIFTFCHHFSVQDVQYASIENFNSPAPKAY